MVKSREEAQSLRELLSFTKKMEEHPLMTHLLSFQERISHAQKLLTDPEKTAFLLVTLPEALPIAVIRRFINWFTEFGIPVGGVVVNGVIETDDPDSAPEFVRNRITMQTEHLDHIAREFEGMVRGVVPLRDDEIRGPGMLKSTAEALFSPG